MGTFADVVNKYHGYSLDGAGAAVKEIESLQFLWSDNPAFDHPKEMVDPSKKLVLVVVEARLLDSPGKMRYNKNDFLARLLIFKYDLLREGYQAKFLKMKTYCGTVHQDGKTLLAMREFFRDVRNMYKQLEGVILVGSFPEAMLVRTWLRPETHGFDMRDDSGKLIGSFVQGTKAYHVGCGVHAYRSEIVLADLDGNWRNIYHQTATVLSGAFVPATEQAMPANVTKVTANKSSYVVNHTNYQDFFWIKDDDWQIEAEGPAAITLQMNTRQINPDLSAVSQLNPELSSADRSLPNAIARPDIFVSRLNARHIAVTPDPRLLDSNKQPQRTTVSPPINTNIFDWLPDADLERTLLVHYFDRNHAFRAGQFSAQKLSLAKIEHELGFYAVDRGLDGIATAPVDTVQQASLLDFVRWLKRPASVRGIGAHTSGRGACMTVFRDDQQYAAIEAETGGHPWRWIEQNGAYIPSFQGHHTADLNLYRTLWANKTLQNLCPSFFVHVGCDVNTPDGADSKSFCTSGYGACNSAEGALFYLNGLALLSRSKMFYDGPSGFGKGFGASKKAHFGNGWKEHFNTESLDPGMAKNSTDRKRSSFWSMIGDWTLRKYYTPAVTSAKQLVTAANQNGRIELLYTGMDDRLFYCTQINPNGTWVSGIPLGGAAKQMAVAKNLDGRLELFYIGTNNAVYHNWQIDSNGCWTIENWLGGWAKQLTVASNKDGRLEIFYIGTDDKVYHNWQTSPNGSWSGEYWLGGWAKQLAVAPNQDGRLEVFYIGTNNELYHNWQLTPNGAWTVENSLGGRAKQLTVATNQDGRLEIFYIGTDNKLYHNWQTKPNSGWTVENWLGGWAKQLLVTTNQEGRLEVFYVGTDDKIYHNWQTKLNSGWSGENWLGGWAKQIALAKNQDGRLEIFYIGTNNRLYHNWQTTPNGGWTIENAL